MPLLDAILHVFLMMNGLTTHPVVLVVIGFLGAYLGGRIMEIIPYTRRIIERREAQAAERQ